jgi:hypothetical protein
MFFSSKKGELKLILDVQSSIVRGTLVLVRPAVQPHVIFTHSVAIPYKTNAQSSYLVKNALDAIQEILVQSTAHAKARAKVEEVPHTLSSIHYVLSSPWVISQAKMLRFSFKDNTLITQSYIQNLIKEERSKISVGDDEIKVIEEKVFDVRMNGYSLAQWVGHRTKELEISFVSSVAGSRMVERFIDVCHKSVSSQHIYFHSSLFLQHLGIQEVFQDHSNYALVHVHGELTDVAIIYANSCQFFGSYPLGVHTVVRTMAREAKIDQQSAESLLSTYSTGNLDPHFGKKEASLIETLGTSWTSEFKKILETGLLADRLPHHIIISAHSHEAFFVQSFKQVFPQVTIDLLGIEDVLSKVSFDMYAEKLVLASLYILAIHNLDNK